MAAEKKNIKVSDITIEWDPKTGTCSFEKLPVAMMWVDTTLAGLMAGVQAMVGTDRFGLALQSEGRNSVEADWQVISKFATFEEGFQAIANIAAVAGWGQWEIVSLDVAQYECVFRVKNSWEGKYQKTLGVCWGSGMLAGKLAGYCTKLFKTNCWAEQTKFTAKDDEYDVFLVRPSEKTIEKEIDTLLQADSTTKADMAVALKKLQVEVEARTRVEKQLLKAQENLEFWVAQRTEELKESEVKFRSIIESSPMGVHIWEISPEGKLIFSGYNPAADKILATDHRQFLGKEILDAFPALTNTIVPEKYREICNKGIHWQTEQIDYEDEKIKGAYEVHAFQTSPGKMAAFFLDVTERREMQGELAQSEERMQLALNAANVAIWDWNIQTGEIYFSPTYYAMLGYEPNELKGNYETWDSLLHEDDKKSVIERVTQYLDKRQGWDIEFRLRGKNGDYRWIRGRGNVVEVDDEGNLLRAYGTNLDITEEKEAQEILKKSDDTLKSIIVAAPAGIGLVHNRVFSWVSERIAEMTGYEVNELVGQSARMLYPSEEEFQRVGAIKYGKLEKANVGEVNTVWKKKSGELINIHLRSSPVDPQDFSRGVTFTALDITEKLKDEENVRRLERQVLQSKNLESLGVLAGGIAHDFNNILMAILGNLSLVSQSNRIENAESSLISEAEKACLRARDLTQQLLTFAKGGEPIKETSSMEGVIVDSGNFVLRGSAVACRYDIPEDLWLVEIDRSQMSQVIQNIIINAKNAMPKGGEISVSCRNINDIQNENVPLPGGNHYIKISIADQGIGIPANIIDKIFEPYFSTKQEGSGLGLAITHSIVTRHQGYIYAESEIGAGATFVIYLPTSDKQLNMAAGAASLNQGERFRILIMDDEEMVRDVTQAMLINLGHEVRVAADGHEAVEIYKQADKPIDIIIMDLTIPGGMGGQDAVKEVLKINPAAKVIVASGYSNDPVMANFRDYGFSSSIVKPFQLHELSEVIAQLMS